MFEASIFVQLGALAGWVMGAYFTGVREGALAMSAHFGHIWGPTGTCTTH